MTLESILINRVLMVFIIPFLLGLLSSLGFQPYNFTFINFIIIPALFLILSHVNKKLKNKYRKKSYLKNFFFIGYLFGFGYFLSGIYWISFSLTFDENLKYLIPFATVCVPLFLALFFGLGTLIVGPHIYNNFSSILIFCSSFSFIDYMRSKILTGFPWNIWSYSWSWFPEILQILNPIGLFAFNLLTLTIFCLPLMLIFKKNKYNLNIFFIIAIIFFSNYIYGSYKINQNKKYHNSLKINQEKFVNIKIVSPNFDLKYNQSLEEIKILINKLIKYSAPEKDRKTIFVWPEGVFAGYEISEIRFFKEMFKNNFSKNHIIVFGINTKKRETSQLYNSMVVINNNFDLIYQYNKKKLVPFGEFLPFEKYLNNLNLKKITHGYGSFAKGEMQKNLIINKFSIFPLICYEIIFPELTQKSPTNTNLIVNISEDGWFGGSVGPKQHFVKSIYRAIENNSYVVRSANKGISAFIDNNGKVIKKLEPTETGNIELNIPFIDSKSKNKNDLIFFILLFTYMIIFFTMKKNINDKK